MKTMKDLERSLAISKIVPILVSLSLENPKVIEYFKSLCKLFYAGGLNIDTNGINAYVFVSNEPDQDMWFKKGENDFPFTRSTFIAKTINRLIDLPEKILLEDENTPYVCVAFSSEAPCLCKSKTDPTKKVWGFNHDTHRVPVCSLSSSLTTVEELYGIPQGDTVSSLRNVAIHLGVLTT